ncbi:neuraminidase-like domain-containing protein [Paenibacillus nanensis]|nr:neuraminidase-like domain-containing protein [Paenibacillus nanensis]
MSDQVQYKVYGQVQCNQKPFAKVTVQAFHLQFQDEVLLGTAVSDEQGNYQIVYAKSAEEPIHLQVRAGDSGRPLAASPTVFNAGALETIHLTATGVVEKSEWEQMEEALLPLLKKLKPHELKEREIEYLVGTTPYSTFQVTQWAAAYKSHQEVKKVSAACFFGLLRMGFAGNADQVASYRAEELTRALQEAANQQLIPALAEKELEGVVSALKKREREQLKAAARDYNSADEIIFVSLLKDWTDNKSILLQEIRKLKRDGETFIQTLVRQEASDWVSFLEGCVSHGLELPAAPGEQSKEEQLAFIADQLLYRIEKQYTNAFISYRLKQQGVNRLKQGPSVLDRLADFFEQAEDFDLKTSVIDDLFKERKSLKMTPDAAEQEELTSRLKAFQRVAQVAPRFAHFSALIQEGYDSAYQISSVSQPAFVQKFKDTLGEAQAQQIYANAEHLTATMTHLITSMRQAVQDATPAIMREKEEQSASALAAGNLPDWASLFGRLDICECEECRSVYSPAAYLVDLLQFLNPKEASPYASKRPIEVLLARRPDIERLKLTCENTNTTLPYIDLVNEVLESYIVLGRPVENNTSEAITSEALDVNREYNDGFSEDIFNQAYALLKDAIFPFELPFDRHLESIRAYLKQLHTSRYDLMELFPNSSLAVDRAGEYVGMSSKDVKIWLDGEGLHPLEYFGYTMYAPGLSATYYSDQSMGSAINYRYDATPTFYWSGEKLPVPRGFAVQWEGLIVPNKTDYYTFQTSTEGSVRLWIDDELIIDAWTPHRLAMHTSAYPFFFEEGKSYSFRIAYADTSTTPRFGLTWSYKFVNGAEPEAHNFKMRISPEVNLQYVPYFLRKTDLSYEELLELLSLRYINPDPLAPEVKLVVYGNENNMNDRNLIGLEQLNYAPLGRMHRFIRLWRKLGISMQELDKLLLRFGNTPTMFLVSYVEMKKLQQKLQGSYTVSELLSLWFRMDTEGNPSHYHSIYLNKSLFNPPDADFELTADHNELAGKDLLLYSKKPILQAALRITEAELLAILEDANLPVSSAKLNLLNVTTLYRYVFLARALKCSISDLIAYKLLFNLNPFAAPTNTLKFIDLLQTLKDSSFPWDTIKYLYFNDAKPATVNRVDQLIAGLRKKLTAGFEQIVSDSQVSEEEQNEQKRLLIIHALSEAFQITVPLTAWFIESELHSSGADTQLRMIRDFEQPEGLAFALSIRKLDKVAQLLQNFQLNDQEVQLIVANKDVFGQLDWNSFTAAGKPAAAQIRTWFQQWLRLAEYARLKQSLIPTQQTWFDLFQEARRTGATLSTGLDKLSSLTGWDRKDLEIICGASCLNLNLQALLATPSLLMIESVMTRVKQIGLSVEQLSAWMQSKLTAELSKTVKSTVKARLDDQTWQQSASVIEDELRRKQRAALVAYVKINKMNASSEADLYDHFLIDVEMGACMKTSRIKQAIASVQLFVQRCLLNLESEVPPIVIDAKKWEWMKNYRLWEANRKVFLYPENWIEPELRDDKTPFFKKVESELLQNEMTEENAENALRGYLEMMDEVAHLDIMGMDELVTDTERTLHVFGRTESVPHIYYHRTRKDNIWSPWVKLDAEIQGNHFIPVVFNRRLYLFWPVFEKTAPPGNNIPTQDQQGSTPKERFTLKLAWSEYRKQKWSKKKMSTLQVNLPEITYGVDEQQEKLWYGFRAVPFSDKIRFDIGLGLSQTTWDVTNYHYRHLGLLWFDINENFTYAYDNSVYTRSSAVSVRQLGMQLASLNDKQALTYFYSAEPASSSRSMTFLGTSQSGFRLTARPDDMWFFYAHQYRKPSFFYQDSLRTYLAEHRADWGNGDPNLQFTAHYHPFIMSFMHALNMGGIDSLFSKYIQTSENTTAFQTNYQPTANVYPVYPRENVDFEYGSAYGVYNWELFFHVPLMVADRLSKEQRFEEAKRWFHYIFNPTSHDFDNIPTPWNFKPFRDNPYAHAQIWDLLLLLADPEGSLEQKEKLRNQVAAWRQNPFEPHRIARMRISAYQKNVVMKYIDNLLSWGDQLFAQDTMESINEATQLYILAHHILGPRPESMPPITTTPSKSYSEIKQELDEFSNVLVEAQNRFPYAAVEDYPSENHFSAANFNVIHSLYFGIPRNDKLLSYWDKVEDRLNKIRSCLNIDGVARSLSLFEAPIDPAIAVKAKSAGLDLGTVLTDSQAAPSHYRFSYLLPKALELVQEVKSLGGQLLSALEKKDSEALSVLRAKHEPALLQLIRQIKQMQIDEAKNALEGIERTKAVTQYRYDHYRSLEFTNVYEKAHLVLTGTAANYQTLGQVAELAAAIARALPDIDLGVSGWAGSPVVKARYGGSNAGAAVEAFSRSMNLLASIANTSASMSATMGGYARRSQDWKLQENLASRELAQIEKQIASQQIRIMIAERELSNHELQIQNSLEVESFLRDKYTNEDLYQWMVSQISGLFFNAYQLAYQAAKKAEAAYRFERGITTSNYIRFGHWDSMKKGLLSGERLYLDLKNLELAYQEQNAREYELTKQVSLLHLDPLALLALKTTGKCVISLPEALFDMDHPGHYMRRIKGVTLTIPCVTGPYTGVNGRLTLESSKIRTSKLAAGYAEQRDEDFLTDFTQVESIATSTGQNDSGLFELSFRDERYLPFEGAGVISQWQLELPKEANGFDFDTISDVILKIMYTAREGGDLLRKAAVQAAQLPAMPPQGVAAPAEKGPAQSELHRMFSLRHEFANEWRQFMYPPAASQTQACRIVINPERFPYRYRGRTLKIERLQVFLQLKEGIAYPNGKAELELTFYPAGSTAGQSVILHSDANYMDGVPQASIPIGGSVVTYDNVNDSNLWTFEAAESKIGLLDPSLVKTSVSGVKQLNPDAIEDMIVLCRYKAE